MMDPDTRPPGGSAEGPADPRRSPGFVSPCFPSANGATALECDDPRNQALALEFQAAYYEINLRYRRLRDVRAEPEAPDFAHQERAALQAVEVALVQRDALEDRVAPLGVIAEPVMREGFAVDLRFTFGSTDASGRYRSEPIVSSALLTFQVPESKRGQDLRPPGAGGPQPCAG